MTQNDQVKLEEAITALREEMIRELAESINISTSFEDNIYEMKDLLC